MWQDEAAGGSLFGREPGGNLLEIMAGGPGSNLFGEYGVDTGSSLFGEYGGEREATCLAGIAGTR
ncbi:hypothetical protein [Paenibacillus whitsoniae]|uniref:Uncharacterized protein n=1 Tax=Paenibacillus whitsoniae TaxID=2496558 RepID=A0A3S0CVR6_9BACL|nr:hypothetical protein [Paenibacillus whitsoniae]RTE09882.1 hypothetical protein EJQ19_10145 [Paenibacillus whitsoniae]